MSAANRDKGDSADRRLDAAVTQYLQAIDNGESPDREQLIAEHPDLAVDLRDFFAHRDRMQELLDPLRSAAARVLNVRCPHCHNVVELLDHSELTDIDCPKCGSSFSLVTDSVGDHMPGGSGRIGQFQLIEQVGVGQFGNVWKARDLTLERTVAIKIPRSSGLNQAETEMFLRDARFAAQLAHQNIVSVHEVGKHEDVIYIVSDFIEGKTLKQWIEGNRLTPRESVELCLKLARALHHAHEAGVVHRDLKPGNVMMDRAGEPHVVDFGLAKRDSGEVTMTLDGQILGTPAYMSPEQARGRGHQVDRTADIYSLGVILFELLTGELPFRGDKQMLLAQILRDAPPSPRSLDVRISRDLETMCLKCLEKEPHQRYATALEFAEDCQRYLNGVPIHARPVSQLSRGWRWFRRNPTVAGLLVTVAALAIGIAVVSTVGYFTTRSALRVSQAQAETIEQNLYYSEMNRAATAAQDPQGLAQVKAIVEQWQPDHKLADRRGWEWHYLWSLLHEQLAVLNGHAGKVLDVAWSPAGEELASAGEDASIRIWSPHGQPQRSLTGHEAPIESIDWSPDASLLASASHDGTVRIWDTTSWKATAILPHDGPANAVRWSPDGQRLATASIQNSDAAEPRSIVNVWRTDDWRLMTTMGPIQARCRYLSWHPTRPELAVGVEVGATRIWNVDTTEETKHMEGDYIAWNADGSLVAVGRHNLIDVLEADSGNPLASTIGLDARTLTWSPNRPWIAYTSGYNVISLFDVRQSAEVMSLRGYQAQVMVVCWHPQGHRIATGAADGTVNIWSTARPPRFLPGAAALSWNPHGREFVTRRLKEVIVVDPRTAQIDKHLHNHSHYVFAVAWSPDGRRVASSGYDGVIQIVHVGTGSVECTAEASISRIDGARLPAVLAWSPDSRSVAFLRNDRTIRIIDAQTGDTLHDLGEHRQHVRTFDWSPDGSRIASVAHGEPLRIWNVASGQVDQKFEVHEINAVAWSPDGSMIAGASGNTAAYLWDATTGDVRHLLLGHTTFVQSIAWHPAGRRVASADESGSVRIWDVRTGKQTLELKYPGGVPMVAWSADGDHLAAVAYGGEATVRIWSATVAAPVDVLW